MKKLKFLLIGATLAIIVCGTFAGKRHPTVTMGDHYALKISGSDSTMGDLYALKISDSDSTYYQLTSGSVLTDGFTTTNPGRGVFPSTITDVGGNIRPLLTKSGSKYYVIYATNIW